MPITGTFLADFSQFSAAVKGAEVTLKGFESNSNKVQSSLSRMTDAFSGRRVIQEATLMAEAVERIGGTSRLTEKELARVSSTAGEAVAKMRAMGVDVPPGIQRIADAAGQATGVFGRMGGVLGTLAGAFGVAFSIGAVVNFGRAVLNTADNLTKLHDRTGLSVEALQQFQIAGDDAGNTMDELAAAVVQMENRIAGGDKSAVTALNKLGLSLEEIRRLSPEDQFIAISDAIRQIEDPAEQVNIAMDLFGRTGANVLPTLKRGFDDTRHAVVTMSNESVAALDSAGDAIGRFAISLKNLVGEGVGQLLLAFTDPLGETKRQLDALAEAAVAAAPKIAGIAPPGLPDDLAEIEAGLTKNAEALIKQQLEAENVAVSIEKMIGAQKRFIELAPLSPKDVSITPENFQPTGAFKSVLDEAAAAREQAEALALVEQQMTENFLVVGQYADAQTAAGVASASAADQAVRGYAAVASSLGTATAESERFIVSQRQLMDLGEAQRQFNRGRATSTQEDLLRGFEIVTARGGAPAQTGGGMVINVDARESFYDTPDGINRLATKVGDALVSQRRSVGGTA